MSSYPEKIPDSVSEMKNFYFNLDSSKIVKKELEIQVSNLNDRIDKIVDHFTLDDIPIIRFILGQSHDKDELKKLAKALDRVADLVELKDKLIEKLQVIKTAEKDPNWFALTFGDFSVNVDLELDDILYGENDD